MDNQDTNLDKGNGFENNQMDSNNEMASLLESEGTGIEFPVQGEIRKGVIASITPGQILVSVGAKSEGVISGKEYELIPPAELAELKIGQEIPVYVINPEDQNGNLVLSFVRAREEEGWQIVDTMMTSKASYHSSIIGFNKGGLIVPVVDCADSFPRHRSACRAVPR